jgi:putative ABC transport system permease protein
MTSLGLTLKWSWRDLRAHWAKVLSIALVIAIGTGAYAGLSSNANWRRSSYAASYDLLAMHDVRIDLPTGAFIAHGRLGEIAASIPSSGTIAAVEERLVVPTQVAVQSPDGEVLVRGELTGADFDGGGPAVDAYHAFTGRMLTQADSGEPTVMIERLFAQYYELPDTGSLELSGGRAMDYVAQATTPEYFAVVPEGEIFLSEASFAGVFTTLETAQALADAAGEVNELVLTLRDGADRDAVAAEIDAALAAAGVGADVTTRDENAAYRTLTLDVDNDQKIFNALAFLLFAGAVVAAYIMIHRFAQQQRREIGVAMALGARPRRIAVRSLLVSAQIALLGVVFGVAVGMLLGNLMKGLLQSFIPLPIWDTSFQTGLFATVAVVGFGIPFLATVVPIAQAVRVKPIDAIKPLYHKAVPTGRRSRREHGHGTTFSRMPLHNLRRSPWRSVFTTLSIALAMTVLVAFLGMLDSIFRTVDVAEDAAIGTTPDRLVVSLSGYAPADGPAVAAIAAAAEVQLAEPTLRLGAVASSADDEFPILLELLDFDGGLWRPSIDEGAIADRPGIVLAREAAADLGADVGDTVTIRHPKRTGLASFTLVAEPYEVLAIHPYPVRGFAYMDARHAGLMGLDGVSNVVQVIPEPGAEAADVARALFSVDGVASVQSVAETTQHIRDQLEEFTGIIQAFVVPVLILAILIAFLTASINLDARSREHATMFAFGVRVRTAVAMAVTESSAIGITATVLGLAGGIGAVQWMMQAIFASTLPEVGMVMSLSASTVVTVFVMGVVGVAVAPVFTVRRMRRMDLPGTLRLVE